MGGSRRSAIPNAWLIRTLNLLKLAPPLAVSRFYIISFCAPEPTFARFSGAAAALLDLAADSCSC